MQKQDSTGHDQTRLGPRNILLETDGSNVIQVVYTLQPMLFGNLISQRRGGVTSFYLFDALGTTTQLADGAGGVSDTYLYDSFGIILQTTGSTTNLFRFTGQSGCYQDVDVSTHYLRARVCDPATGRFLSQDPIGIVIPVNSLYEYALNNPTNQIDPSGLFCFCPFAGHTGYIYIDKSCAGVSVPIWLVDEDSETPGPPYFPFAGKWYPVDGFYLGQQLYKVDGSTCVTIDCENGIINISCCIHLIASCIWKLRCPYPVGPKEFGGPPKAFPVGAPIPTPRGPIRWPVSMWPW